MVILISIACIWGVIPWILVPVAVSCNRRYHAALQDIADSVVGATEMYPRMGWTNPPVRVVHLEDVWALQDIARAALRGEEKHDAE